MSSLAYTLLAQKRESAEVVGDPDNLFLRDPPQDYCCQICMKVLTEPHVTECCGQHFCKACLEKWFDKNPGERICPHCREANFVHILYKPLQRKINELEIRCSNMTLGCEVTLKLGDLGSHLSATNPSGCGYVSIPCPNECGMKVIRNGMGWHVEGECAKREESCPDCGVRMLYDRLAAHYEICEEVRVSCLRNCGRVFRRGDQKIHENECPELPVKCPFYDAGCHIQLVRKNLDEHVEKSNTAHFMKFIAAMKSDVASLKAENEAMKSHVESLKAENKLLKAESVASKIQFKDLCSNVAVEVSAIKSAMSKATSPVISNSLECIESSLKGYNLNSVGDFLTFSVPRVPGWKSPPFLVLPGYSMCVRVQPNMIPMTATSTAVSLLLLSGDMDDLLKWPMKIGRSITVYSLDVKPQRPLAGTLAGLVSPSPPPPPPSVALGFNFTTAASSQQYMKINPDSLSLLRCEDQGETLMGQHNGKQPAYIRIHLV